MDLYNHFCDIYDYISTENKSNIFVAGGIKFISNVLWPIGTASLLTDEK